MDKVYTEKQLKLMRMWRRGELKRLNILEGSVRSGKTWISLVLWAFWVACMPRDGAYLMVAKTLTSLRRNVLDLLTELVGGNNFSYSLSKKEARLFGRLVYLEGVNDARAEGKIRGMTLTGAYCDELTLFTEDFFAMLLSRLSEHGAKLFATTNPDSPNHWLMLKYLKRADELDLLRLKFTIDDNDFLDKEYVEQLKREYTGVFFERFVLGKWAVAEGLIYPLFANTPERFIIDAAPEGITHAVIGVDFGGSKSAHAFALVGFTKDMRVVLLDEYYHVNKDAGKLSPEQLERAFVDFVRRAKERYKVYTAYCDSAEQTLIKGLAIAATRERLGIEVKNARKRPINDRIAFYSSLMAQDRFNVVKSCTATTDALKTAMYDAKKLEDTRLDDGTTNIDSLDALEYCTESVQDNIMYLGLRRR